MNDPEPPKKEYSEAMKALDNMSTHILKSIDGMNTDLKKQCELAVHQFKKEKAAEETITYFRASMAQTIQIINNSILDGMSKLNEKMIAHMDDKKLTKAADVQPMLDTIQLKLDKSFDDMKKQALEKMEEIKQKVRLHLVAENQQKEAKLHQKSEALKKLNM